VPSYTYAPTSGIPLIRPTGLRSVLMTHVQVWESVDASINRYLATSAAVTKNHRVLVVNEWVGPSGVGGQHATMRAQSSSLTFLQGRDLVTPVLAKLARKAYLRHLTYEVTATGKMTITNANEGSKLGYVVIELSGM